jgi:hypothetical protein
MNSFQNKNRTDLSIITVKTSKGTLEFFWEINKGSAKLICLYFLWLSSDTVKNINFEKSN